MALVDEAKQSIRFPYLYNLPPELSEVSTPLDAGVTAQILTSKRPILVEDYAHHPRRLRTFVEAGVKSGVGAPLLVGERAMGTLAVVALWQPKRFSEEDAELLRAVADQAAVAIENARLYESTTTQLQQIESLKTFNESIVEGVSEGISIEDLSGILTFVNPRLAKMLGYAREELLGQPWNSLIAPQDRAKVAEETAKYPLGVPTRYEVSFRRKDGSTLPVIVSARPLFREGTFVGVLAVSTDISDRKQAEKELERRTRELAALHAIAETVNRSLDLDQILTSALDQVLKVMEIQAGTIHILEPASETLQLKASFGLSEAMQRDVQQVRLGEGFSGRVARTGEPIMIEDYGQHPYRLMREASDFRAFATIPLKSKERVWGTLSVIDRRFRNFKAEDLSLLIAIGNEIAVAVENAHLYAETKRHLEEVSALHSVAMAASSVSNLEDVLARITETLRQALGYESGGILLLDEERGELTLHRAWGLTTEGHPPFQIPVGRGITGWVAQTGEPLLVPEVTKDRRYVPAIPGTQSEMCAPLRIGQRIIGVLNVESPRRNAFSEHDLALLDTLASQVASTIENVRLHQQAVEHAAQLERRTESLALIHSLSKAVSSTLELEQIFRIAMEEMVRTFRVDQSAILLFDADKGYAKLVAEHQPSATAEPLLIPLRGNPAMERILSTRQPLAIEDVQSDPLLEPVRPVMVQRGIHSSLIVPLIAKDELIGTIGLDVTRGPRRFTAEEIELAQTIAQEISGAIERARLYEETKRLAITDSLTGLYNVRYFYQELDRELVRSRRYERPLSLIMMDIDNFKRYNDTYGHLAGDDLLRELAALLNEMIRRTDILARYGGEEFMIVLPETDAPEASALAERIAEQVRNHPFAVRFSELKGQITISCGVATFPQHAQTSRDLVHAADTALYQAKGTKDRIFTFEVARK
ncbi:MAG: GAF domain-containing protein [Chloroflexi bacterium]|nr:GAF domain-containing protein [Chloroflexota bacterium]